MLNNVAYLMKKITKNDSENNTITATQSFQKLMQATADALDAREEGIQAGIIPTSMPTEEIIPYLYTLYVFFGYEKKFSPIVASNLLKIYCPESFFVIFESYYRKLAEVEGIDISTIDFNNDSIIPFIDIPAFAKKSVKMGNKRHWNPFKEPYRCEWDSFYESKGRVRSEVTNDTWLRTLKKKISTLIEIK